MGKTIYVEAIQGKSSPIPVYQFKVYRIGVDGSDEVIYRSVFSYVSKESTLRDGVLWCAANGYPDVQTVN